MPVEQVPDLLRRAKSSEPSLEPHRSVDSWTSILSAGLSGAKAVGLLRVWTVRVV